MKTNTPTRFIRAAWMIPALFIVVLLAAAPHPADDPAAARARQVQGLFIFMYAEPAAPHDYLGTVKGAGMTWGGTQEETMTSIIKRTKKQYPEAQGIVFQPGDFEKVDAIKFK